MWVHIPRHTCEGQGRLYEVMSLLPPLVQGSKSGCHIVLVSLAHFFKIWNRVSVSRKALNLPSPLTQPPKKAIKLHHQTQRKIRWSKCVQTTSPKFNCLQIKQKKKENFSLKDILRSLSCPPCHDQPLRTESAVCMIQGSKRWGRRVTGVRPALVT